MLETLLLLLNAILHVIYSFSELRDIVLDLSLEEFIYLGDQLFFICSDCIFFILNFLVIYHWALLILRSFEGHHNDFKFIFRLHFLSKRVSSLTSSVLRGAKQKRALTRWIPTRWFIFLVYYLISLIYFLYFLLNILTIISGAATLDFLQLQQP